MGPGVVLAVAALAGLVLSAGSRPGTRTDTASLQKTLPVRPGRAWPLPGYPTLSSGYGWRLHPITGERQFHTGIDIPAPWGTAVQSPVRGQIVRIERDCGLSDRCPNGNAVFVLDADGLRWALLHLDQMYVRVGQTVMAGAVVGTVGVTGRTTGPHLHLQVILPDGGTKNPLALVRA